MGPRFKVEIGRVRNRDSGWKGTRGLVNDPEKSKRRRYEVSSEEVKLE